MDEFVNKSSFQKKTCCFFFGSIRQNHPRLEPENDGLEDVVSYWNCPFFSRHVKSSGV